MSRTALSSQSEKVNTAQNIFWKSETAIERILLVLSGVLLWKPGFWLILLVCYGLFEGVLLLGRYAQKKGILIGAQVVVTGALLLLFHEIPVIYQAEDAEEEGSYLSSIGIIASLALAAYVILVLLSKIPVAMGVLIVAVDVYIVIKSIYGYPLERAAVAAAITLTILELWRATAFLSDKINKKDREVSYMGGRRESLGYRWLVLFVLLEVLVFSVPVNEKPIDWSFVYRIGYRVRDGIETLAENTGYYLSGIGEGSQYQSGYSGFSLVPGEISGSTREELYITTEGTKNSLYLAGYIDGDQAGISEEMKGERLLDFLYALYSHDVTREEARCFGRVMKLTIEFGYLRTRDIIRPANTLIIDYLKKDEIAEDGLQFKKTHKKGCRYDVSYLNVDYGSRYLEKIMRTAAKSEMPSYSEMEDYCGKLYDFQLSRCVTEAEYKKWTERKEDFTEYLDPGELATSRMKELADDITRDAENEYDACRRIEKYLRQYKYSTNPGKGQSASENKQASGEDNFIERFLFETGEGYCVHYASSMVELLRLSGIPARYVEGYCYTFPEVRHDIFTVTGDRAHAWVEAYVDGVGWVPFEPTTARRTSIDSSWNYTFTEEEQADEADVTAEYEAEQFVPDIPDNTAANLTGDESGDEEEPKRHVIDVTVMAKTIGIILAGLVIYALLMWAAIVIIRALRYRNSPLAGKLEKNIKDILWFMDREFIGKGEQARVLEDYVLALPSGETVRGDRLEITDLKELSGHIFSVYYRQRFAGRSATGAEVRDSEYLKKHLMKRYIQKKIPGNKLRMRMKAER
ncbi:transglutaminase-like domain-containing protein [Butyrivibrio sp. FC2001]|uniref:transglutaminase-like domain-containing protein n=1 Tax=Butyrivibrio sp. FC2001 TaxID=1280671 RepID=UPI0009DB981E|nr:transglutaminase-like domain-containing protein [Butyrivibrio sp. FC2001]